MDAAPIAVALGMLDPKRVTGISSFKLPPPPKYSIPENFYKQLTMPKINFDRIDDIILDVIIDQIVEEMNTAATQHPVWPTDPVKRAAIVAEEAGEVIREANHIEEGHGDLALLKKELIQTAGTCLRMLHIMELETPLFKQKSDEQ